MEKQNRIWKLLAKKTAGEASENELLELGRLLSEEEGIERIINVLDHYWEGVANSPENEEMNAMLDSNRVLAEVKMNRGMAEGGYNRRKRVRKMLAVAAVILFVAGGAVVLYNLLVRSGKSMNIVSTKNGSRTEVTLPDGTQVRMNGGSVLSYPSNFENAAKREVTVSGEAFFDVKHDSSHPFVIHTKYLDIKDIGTVFNVKAYPDEAAEATLISGSIEVNVRDRPREVLRLQPKEKVVYDGSNHTGHLSNRTGKSSASGLTLRIIKVKSIIGSGGDTIVPETAWANNQFVFQSEPFSVLAERMERWYNAKIYFKSDEVRGYVFTGIFEGETLEESLRELQMSRAFNYRVTKDSVIIDQ